MSTPEERSSAARLAAHTRWAYHEPDRSRATQAARANSPASLEYWLARVDPDQRMSHSDRVKAAENAKSAHYAQLSRRGMRARRTDPAA